MNSFLNWHSHRSFLSARIKGRLFRYLKLILFFQLFIFIFKSLILFSGILLGLIFIRLEFRFFFYSCLCSSFLISLFFKFFLSFLLFLFLKQVPSSFVFVPLFLKLFLLLFFSLSYFSNLFSSLLFNCLVSVIQLSPFFLKFFFSIDKQLGIILFIVVVHINSLNLLIYRSQRTCSLPIQRN